MKNCDACPERKDSLSSELENDCKNCGIERIELLERALTEAYAKIEEAKGILGRVL